MRHPSTGIQALRPTTRGCRARIRRIVLHIRRLRVDFVPVRPIISADLCCTCGHIHPGRHPRHRHRHRSGPILPSSSPSSRASWSPPSVIYHLSSLVSTSTSTLAQDDAAPSSQRLDTRPEDYRNPTAPDQPEINSQLRRPRERCTWKCCKSSIRTCPVRRDQNCHDYHDYKTILSPCIHTATEALGGP